MMKYSKLLKAGVAVSAACLVLLSGCAKKSGEKEVTKAEMTEKMTTLLTEELTTASTEELTVLPTEEVIEEQYKQDDLITQYNWEGMEGGSLIVCETDGTFKYYEYATDLTNNYFDGTYEFYRGEDALRYLDQELPEYNVTREEMIDFMLLNLGTQYYTGNLVCLVLNNEHCMMDGEDVLDGPHRTPYYGFAIKEDGQLYLDIANMNSGNKHPYKAVERSE